MDSSDEHIALLQLELHLTTWARDNRDILPDIHAYIDDLLTTINDQNL